MPASNKQTALKNLPLTHEEVGFGCRLAIVLLNVLGFVGDHADERVELQDGDAQVDDVHWVSKETPECWCKLCREDGTSWNTLARTFKLEASLSRLEKLRFVTTAKY